MVYMRIGLNIENCSESCDGGGDVQYRERKRNSPPPKYGDKNCDRRTRESHSYGETECPSTFRTFLFLSGAIYQV